VRRATSASGEQAARRGAVRAFADQPNFLEKFTKREIRRRGANTRLIAAPARLPWGQRTDFPASPDVPERLACPDPMRSRMVQCLFPAASQFNEIKDLGLALGVL
jgi:hypothetical protein